MKALMVWLIWAPQPKRECFANRSYHQSVHWQCVKRKNSLNFYTPVTNRVAIILARFINIRNYLNKIIYLTCQSHILYKILLNNLVSHLAVIYTVWIYYTYNKFKYMVRNSFLNVYWHKRRGQKHSGLNPGPPHYKSVTLSSQMNRLIYTILYTYQRENFESLYFRN
jgi:hypothetical protein